MQADGLISDSIRNSDPVVKAAAFDYLLRRGWLNHRHMDEALQFGRASARRKRALAKRARARA